ncbi:TSC22 domain family protein 2 isoform X2 [Pseudorasbora parva]|uniref:TSC22 domain family protein 2 isoform X2 n=1 Tax=Pseudorasbora parva TaxID=51549 RepID=UPI00351DDD2A
MSKMPSKKKSCFQITSVTQAQVAANSIADDTESLDDPDESRTEDASKPGDFEPEACDVSLSDEPEPPGSVQGNPNACATPVSSSVSTCSSRFRVIKLDHGTGEPFKRGRWTCTEFYERDADARTGEAVKHAGVAELGADRDGPGGSVAAPGSTLADPHTDSGYVSAPSNPPAELQTQAFALLHQGLGLVAQNLFEHVKSPSLPSQPLYPAQNAVAPCNPADCRPQVLTQGPSQPGPLLQPAVTVSVPAVPVLMPSASNAPPMPKQSQPQGFLSQADVLLHSSVLMGKDALRPLNPEGLQLHTPGVSSLFGIAIPMDGDEDSASGASVVAIDNKIEQAMDLVKSHLMYAVREEVEVLKEQIKELYERNSALERENAVLKSLANTDQLSQLGSQGPQNTSPPQEGQPSVSTA